MQLKQDPIRVLTVDDHPLVREGIAALVSRCNDIEVVAEGGSAAEGIELFSHHIPDVTLMDVRMPDMCGIDAILAIRAKAPRARVIVLTTYHGDALVQRALKAGAQAYLLKSAVRSDLIDSIRAVYAGQTRINHEVAVQIAKHINNDPLSDRELDVLRLIASGNSNKSIARRLQITEGTVKSHVKSILAKMHASDRTHATTLGVERGMIGF
jgi:DNA-binding NarL/FixJ family response regulator